MAGDRRCGQGAQLELPARHAHETEDVGYVLSLRLLYRRASGGNRIWAVLAMQCGVYGL